MISQDIDKVLYEFSRRQRLLRIVFAVFLIGALVATIAIVAYSRQRAKRAEDTAKTERHRADIADKSLETIASKTLERVQDLDRQTLDLTRPENPTVYLWRNGLHPRKSKRHLSEPVDLKLVSLLHDRRFLLGDASPALTASPKLQDYVCKHMWFVIGESIPASKAKDYVAASALRDPRFQFIEYVIGPPNPSAAGIIVGFFLTHQEAKELAKEVKVPDSAIRRWNYGQYTPACKP